MLVVSQGLALAHSGLLELLEEVLVDLFVRSAWCLFRRHSSGNLSDAAQASRLVDRRACFACTSTSVAVLVDKLTVLALHGGVETLVRTSRIDASCHGPRDVAQAHVVSTGQVVANLIAILPIIDRALLVYSMVKVLRGTLT